MKLLSKQSVFFCLVVVTLFFSVTLFGQTFKPMSNTVALETELKANAQKIKTITSDFTQVKQMKMLEDKVTSKGKFSFMQPDKIRIEYTSPFQYLLIMAGGNVLVKDGKRTTKMNIRNNDAMQSVNQVLMDCMRGTVFANRDFKANAWSSVNQYKIRLMPNDASVRKMLAGIEIYLNKSDMQVTKLVMKEQSGDETDMIFSNTQNNISLSDALFRVH